MCFEACACDSVTEWTQGFSGNLVAGLISGLISSVIASFIVIVTQKLWKEHELRERFSQWSGDYEICDLQGKPRDPRGTVTITYKTARLFEVKTHSDSEDWKGHIEMSEGLPGMGIGVYYYSRWNNAPSNAWGGHQFLFKEKEREIEVRGTIWSSPTSDQFVRLWRRKGAL